MTNRRKFVRRPRATITRSFPLTKAAYVLGPFVSLLVTLWILIMCGVAHAGSTGQAIDLSPDAEGFQIWYGTGAEGWAFSSDDVEIGGSVGQAAIGSPNATSDDPWVTSGFWAPGVSYDTTDVDPTDSTDVVVAVLGIDDPVDGPIAGFALAPVWPNPSHGIAYIRWTVPRAS